MIINGNLDLSGCRTIESLGNLKEVKGSLDLTRTKITSIPDGLKVGGSLDLRGTQITSFPNGLIVKGTLDLSGTNITKEYIEEEFPKLLKKCIW